MKNNMKTNEEIVEELLIKTAHIVRKWVETTSIERPTYDEAYNGLKMLFNEALQSKDEQARQEMIELPRPYAFGIIQADGEDFSQEDKENIYMIFKKEDIQKVKNMMIKLTQLKK